MRPHRALFAAAAFLAIAASSTAAAQEPPSAAELETLSRLQGHWSGHLRRGGDVAAIELDLRIVKGELAGTFDWTDLGYLGAGILSVRLVDDSVRISLPLPVGALRLSAKPDASRLEGRLSEVTRRANEWVTLPYEGQFDLRRDAPEERPYRVEPVRFSSGGVTIAGAVYAARGNGRKPAVVFIHGSGDSDRSDGAFYADQFARSGIVTLVYDKRGVGESAGQWRQGGYGDLAQDAHAGLEYLRSRPDVDPGRIGYVARSEGAWVAPLATRLGGSSFLGVISGPTVSVQDEDLDYYRLALLEAGIAGAELERALDLVRLRHRVMLGKASAESLERAVAQGRESRWFPTLNWDEAEDQASMPFRLATLGYDPAPDLVKIGVPTFWLYGTDDKTIPAADSVARLMALGMEPRPAIRVLPRADHALAASAYPELPGGVQSSARLLADWIVGNAAAAAVTPP